MFELCDVFEPGDDTRLRVIEREALKKREAFKKKQKNNDFMNGYMNEVKLDVRR